MLSVTWAFDPPMDMKVLPTCHSERSEKSTVSLKLNYKSGFLVGRRGDLLGMTESGKARRYRKHTAYAFRTGAAWGEDIWAKTLTMLLCIALIGCRSHQSSPKPFIEFTKVPLAGEGGPDRVATIEGRVVGFRPEQRIVLLAKWGIWWVQPLADRPFTEIQSDSTWRNSTHFGTDYAALLVGPGYHPPARMDWLPSKGDGVVAVAVVKGRPVFWQTWWFRLGSLLAL